MAETKVLVTGSKGMLGSILTEVLSAEFEVKGIDIEDSDIIDTEKTTKIIKNYNPGIIIHTAGFTDVDECELNQKKAFSINSLGTKNVAGAANEVGATLFYISTDYVFDGKKSIPYTESDIPNPVNIYGKSKLEGEEIIRNNLTKYFILRTSWLFGPRGKNFVSTILQKAKENDRLQVVDDQVGSPTYTLDLADAIRFLLSTLNSQLLSGYYGIYHITNAGSCSWYEFAKEIIFLKQL
ncbi:MAG: dTDP-4-dehydrorhamnose reductase, partial [Candidatus Omnitrophica bacterium]|nr:dTDP-4-dehydrorhamnose reductase [Candidatus Omnitrophota bacterium]